MLDLLLPVIRFYPEPIIFQHTCNLLCIFLMPVSNRYDLDLHRRKPHWKRTCIMLNQDTDKPLETAKNHPVNHHWPVLLIILTNISQVKPLRHQKIKLHSPALPAPSKTVRQVKIYLRPVKSTVTLVNLILGPLGIQRILQCLCSSLPYIVTSHRLLRLRRKLNTILIPEYLIEIIHKLNHTCDLILDLRRHHKNMRIILRKASHPKQPRKHTRKLMPVHASKLSNPHRKLPVAVYLLLVKQHPSRAVHRLHSILILVNLCKIHIILIMVPVP